MADPAIQLQNMDSLMTKLKAMGADAKKIGGDIAERQMLIVERAMKEKITDNTDTGKTRAGIRTIREEEEDTVVIKCGTNDKSAIYLEFGTGLYAENGQGRKSPWLWKVMSNKWAQILGVKKGESVLWHGSHPHPFARSAWDENKDAVLKGTKDGLAAAIRKYAK